MASGRSRAPDYIDALVLRLQPVGDADLIVVLLTAARGRLELYARGARKPSKRFGGRLEPFLRGEAAVSEGRGALATLRGFTPKRSLLPVGCSYEQLALASYFAELAAAASQPEHADPVLLRWLSSAVGAAAEVNEGALAETKIAGEIGWLAACGSLADPAICYDCGASTEEGAVWTNATAGPLCARCGDPMAVNISAGLVVALVELSTGEVRFSSALRLQAAAPQALSSLITAQVAALLERPTRSLRGLELEFSLAKDG